MLYADDLVILSNSADGPLKLLNRLLYFCQRWNLKVNVTKTKVIIFNKAGRILKNYS